MQRAIECGLESNCLDRIIVSTDDELIAEEAQRCGAEIPFLRPEQFALDSSPMIDVVLHALDFLCPTYVPDAVLLLQPTSPTRDPSAVRRSVELLASDPEAESVCSVFPVPQEYSPYLLMEPGEGGFLQHVVPHGLTITRRQDLPITYKRDGAIFLTKERVLRQSRTFYGRRCIPLIQPFSDQVNIDSIDDWRRAEAIISKTSQ